MRIACIHVPQFALQSLGRTDSSLRGAAVAVAGAGLEPVAGVRMSAALHGPLVLACSRAAWLLGVRIGMTASAARFVSPEVRVVAADSQLERETVRAIADALLGVSAVVDTGGRVAGRGAHLAMYCEVPSKVRGTTFGDRLIELLAAFGLAARIGIADDRFTAWVAAAHGAAGDDRGVVSVPRGGSAAFLAPRPLSLLAITPEVQHMLESLGVRTLGEFAALPAPSVSRPLEADYQALARGDSGSVLRPYAPEAPIREEMLTGGAGGLFGGAAAVATLTQRVALRLAGRARGAARLDVTIGGAGGERVVAVAADHATSSAHELAELVGPVVDQAQSAVARLGIVVVGEALVGAIGPAREVGAVTELADRSQGLALEASSDPAIDVSSDASIDVLAVALSSASSRAPRGLASAARGLPRPLLAPQTLRPERRDGHRRTRRAKPRRRAAAVVQAQLFGNLDA